MPEPGEPQDPTPGELGIGHFSDAPEGDKHSRKVPDDLGATAVEGPQEAIDVKPLNYIEHEPGIFASEGDPEYVDPNSPSTEHDKEKAKVMASAEDRERNIAAKLRQAANALDLYRMQVAEIERDITNLGPEPEVTARGPFKRARQEQVLLNHRHLREQVDAELRKIDERLQEIVDRREVWHNAGGSSAMLEKARASLYDPEARKELDYWINHFRTHAKNNDERAKERGVLTGILHDKPVSDVYKKSRPFEEPYDTADQIMFMEGWQIPELERELKQLQDSSDEGAPADEVSFAAAFVANMVEELREEYLETVVSPPALKIYKGLLQALESLDDDSTTVGQIKEAVKLINQKLIEAKEAHIKYAKEILDDIKNSRASDPNYKPPEPETPQSNSQVSEPKTVIQHSPETPRMFEGSFDPS